MRKTFLSLVAAALMLTGASRASAQDKPVALISIASYQTLQNDLKFVGELAGMPDLDKTADGLIAVATKAQGIKGLDKTKPMGAAVFLEGETPRVLGFVPIDLKANLANFPQIPVQENDGVMEVQGPGGSICAVQKGAWAFISNDKGVLKNVPADPDKLLGDLSKNYALAVRFNVQNVPEDLRKNVGDIFRAGMEVGLQQKPGEDDISFEFRRKMAQAQLKQMEALFKDLDQFTIGWAIDPSAKTTHLDVSLSVIPTSTMAKQFADMANVKSDFGGFLLPDAAVTLNMCSKFDKADADQMVALVDGARKKANEGIDNDAGIPSDEDKKAVKEVVGQLLDVAKDTALAGKFDLGAALSLQPNSLTLAGGAFIKSGKDLESAIKNLVKLAAKEHLVVEGAADPNSPSIKFDAETYKGVKMHAISVPMNDADGKKFFGDSLEAYLGIGEQSFYFALGKGSLTFLKSAIDKTGASSQGNYPVQVNVALTPIMQFINSTNPNPGAAMAAQLLSTSPGKDHIRITASMITNGVNYRIQAEEGVLKAIGTAAKLVTPGRGAGF